jgi:hypothetical protein
VVLCGAAWHAALLLLLSDGGAALASTWHLPPPALAVVQRSLRLVVAPAAIFGSAPLPSSFHPVDDSTSTACLLTVPLFGAAITAGWPWLLALHLFAGSQRGRPCAAGHGFAPTSTGPVSPGSRRLSAALASDADPAASMTVFFDHDRIVFLHCSAAVFGSADSLRGSVPAWLIRKHTRWLPEYIRLPVDAFGNPILPRLDVAALVDRRHVWDKLVCMDGVTRAIVFGKLCYPWTAWRIAPSYLPNHKSWDVDSVNAKLGQKMATYLFLSDTFRGCMFVLPAKQAVLAAAAAGLAALVVIWTLRALDSVKGQLLHYAAAIPHIRVPITELARLMGPVSEELRRPLAPPSGLPGPLCGALRSASALRRGWCSSLASCRLIGLRLAALRCRDSPLLLFDSGDLGRLHVRLGRPGPVVGPHWPPALVSRPPHGRFLACLV